MSNEGGECCKSCDEVFSSTSTSRSSLDYSTTNTRSTNQDDVDNDVSNDGDVNDDDDDRNNNNNNNNSKDTTTPIRILTWSNKKSILQNYAELYNKSYPQAPTIYIFDVRSLKELDYEVTSELKSESILYDGFVVPPLFLGNMYQQKNGNALAIWDNDNNVDEDDDDDEDISSTSSSQQEQEQEQEQQSRSQSSSSKSYSSLINDLLPYYRYEVATYDDKIRSLPIIAGSQTLLLFRKDYLDEMNLPTPKTWNDWTKISSILNNNSQQKQKQPIGLNDGRPIYGSCIGLLNEDGCRKRNFKYNNDSGTGTGTTNDNYCNSQSMTYLGMMLSSMTQVMGNSTGWMMGLNHNSPITTGVVSPLFQPTLEYILKWMEQQIMTGGPSNQLTTDASYNMQLFRDGRCGMTMTSDYDAELLKDDNVGFVPLPGSDYFLNRSTTTTTDDDRRMKNCTDILCPFGNDYYDNNGDKSTVNLVPFGATDATVGTVSGFISKYRQEETKKFYRFVLESSSSSSNNHHHHHQPLTYSELKNSIVPGYETTITALTSNPNAAIPFRVPNAFNLLSELDNRVYEYLVNGNYDDDNRKRVTQNVVNSWQSMISMYDYRDKSLLPTSVFYEKSLGVFVPVPAEDMYIGWTARGVMWGLGGVSCLLSVCLAIWVWKYQHERVIRASQPVFLYLICGGTLVMALSVFTSGVEDDIATYQMVAASCTATYWLYSLGFVGVITAMFSKIWMLSNVFKKPRNEQRIQITRQDILLPFFVIFGIDFLILLVWTIIDPQQWVRIPINKDLYSLNLVEESTLGWCTSDNTQVYVGVLIALNTTIVVLSLVQSYECRRITTEYSESLWITASITITAQAWIISLPLIILLEDSPQIYFLVRSGTILCTTLPVLLLIFVPKMIYLYEALGDRKESKLIMKQQEEEYEKNKNDNIDGSNNKATPHAVVQQKSEPKGTIGIRIVQFVYLDSDEVNELEEAVDKAEQRNTKLRNTMERLEENLEERKYTRTYPFDSHNHNQNHSATGASLGRSSISGSTNNNSSNGIILAARPENIRHSKQMVRRDTYHE